ncbi:MAG: GntR family transcriptional regulator [Pseudomonadota bacterium]
MTGKTKNISGGDTAFDRVVDLIQKGTYRPGDRLREELLAQHLNLSRTPIREALRRLEAQGIVEHRPRLGAVIRQFSHAEIVELYEMRTVLERTAARLAAKHANRAEIETLEDLNKDIAAERENSAKAAAINQSFHRVLYLAARNRFLLEAAQPINNALMLLGPTTLSDEERIDVVFSQHQAIIDALKTGDQDAAGEAAEAHLNTSMKHRLTVMNQ